MSYISTKIIVECYGKLSIYYLPNKYREYANSKSGNSSLDVVATPKDLDEFVNNSGFELKKWFSYKYAGQDFICHLARWVIKHMTYQNIIKIKNSYRHDIVKLLSLSEGNIGVELGVAKGIFSSRMVDSGYFSSFIGIDMYGDTYHDVGEYKEALRRVGLLSNFKLLRMTFDEAYDLFEDESLDDK